MSKQIWCEGDFNHEIAKALMSRMHEYVDVIIGVNDDNDEDEKKLMTSSYYLHHQVAESAKQANPIISFG